MLVVDANVLFAAAIKGGKTAEMILSDEIELIAPEHLIDEFKKHRAEILEKTGRSLEDFEKFTAILCNSITLVPQEEIQRFISTAEKISPDSDDVPYFALALRYRCAIWSNDSRLKEQSVVRILTTEELLGLI